MPIPYSGLKQPQLDRKVVEALTDDELRATDQSVSG